MTILSARSFLSRSLIPTKLIAERCFGNNKCPMKKPIFQDSQIRIVSRKYSSNSFPELRGEISDTVEGDIYNLGEKLFISLHDLTGLPWWCIIASSALVLKIISLPCTVFQYKIYDKYDLVQKQLPGIGKEVLYEINGKQKLYHWNEKTCERMYLLKMYNKRRKLIVENNCSPLRAFLISCLDLPGWIFLTVIWKRLSNNLSTSNEVLSQMMAEGPIWCSNFTDPDPYYIIPALVTVSRLCNIHLSKVNYDMSYKERPKVFKILFHIARVIALLVGCCSSTLPASVGLFWFFASFFNFIKIVLLAVPKFRRYLGLSWKHFSHRDLLKRFKYNILTTLRIKKKEV